MPEILTRAGKGSDLTPNEADSNFKRTVVAKTGTYTTLSTDNRNLIECSHATVAFTVTLLAVATAAAVDTGDYEVTIFNIGAAIVSVDGNANEPINGATTKVTLNQWESATFKLNNAGTGYNTVSSASELADTTASYSVTTGTKTLDLSLASYFYPSSAMTAVAYTFAFSNPALTGNVSSFILELNDADAASSITWPAAVDWSFNVEPTWTDGIDIVSFITRDAGTTWLGFSAGLKMS